MGYLADAVKLVEAVPRQLPACLVDPALQLRQACPQVLGAVKGAKLLVEHQEVEELRTEVAEHLHPEVLCQGGLVWPGSLDSCCPSCMAMWLRMCESL